MFSESDMHQMHEITLSACALFYILYRDVFVDLAIHPMLSNRWIALEKQLSYSLINAIEGTGKVHAF